MQQLLELQGILNSTTVKLMGINQTLSELINNITGPDKTPLDKMLAGVQYTKMGILFADLTDDLGRIADLLGDLYPNEQTGSI